jgi:hypothetical protein
VPNLVAFRGLGTWVDIYDDAAWGNPLRAVAAMRAHGVRTLYLQTSNYNRHRAMVFPGRTGEFIDAAHKAGMFVVAWYLPDFADVPRDLRRVETALKFRSASGDMFDAFGLDIEAPIVASATVRTRRLLSLADSIRNQAGPAYPLGAIIPSPRGMRVHADYWPGFPFRALTRDFDVDLPMTYFTWRVHGMVATHWYTTQNVKIIRAETAPLVVPIHVIGGLSTNATKDETRGFVEAVRERGVLGASYYDAVKDGDYWPISFCPDCELETLVDEGLNDGSEAPSRRWVCFSCACSWNDDELQTCSTCGLFHTDKLGIGMCENCFDWRVNGPD